MPQKLKIGRDLVNKMRAGHRLSLARLISKIESRGKDLPEIMNDLYPFTGQCEVWGVTGPPGAGKSTLVDRLITELRRQGKKVGVVAVDPSSPFSGGALLGDRIRMQKHAGDSGVFIRSIGTRGRHGGLSHSTKEVVMALDAAGFDIVIVETAGVGQTELEILKLAQTVLVVVVPESGDSIQVMKAGLMEIADLFAVNKSDRPESDKMAKELIQMVGMSGELKGNQGWKTPVLKTEAVQGKGISELVGHIAEHQKFLKESGQREKRFREFLINEVFDILTEKLSFKFNYLLKTKQGSSIISKMVTKKVPPYLAADLFSKIKS